MLHRIGWLHRAGLRLGATPFGAWVLLNLFTPLDRVLLRLSRGRVSTTGLFLPSLTLVSTGAKSGLPRETPLVYLPDGARIVLVASNGGQPRHPAWYHNLRANPAAYVLVDGRERRYRAREAIGAEREQLWARAVAAYPGYAVYQRRTAGRTIPVMVLEPAA